MAQENARATRALEIDPGALVEGYSVLIGPGRYDRLLCIATLEGVPVVTITAPGSLESVTPAAPSPAYLAHIVTGLRETFDFEDAAIVDYLGRAPGATPDLIRAAMAL